MKDLEDDAIRAQAVIVKAQEMQNEETKQAADTDGHTANTQNGDAEVGLFFVIKTREVVAGGCTYIFIPAAFMPRGI